MVRKNLLVVFIFVCLVGCGLTAVPDPDVTPSSSPVSPIKTQPTSTTSPVTPSATLVPATKTPLRPTPTQIPPTATQSPPGESALGDKWTRPIDNMVMIYIPAGEFEMGSTESNPCAHLDEFPQHTVYLDGYWMDQTQVTNAQFQQCVEAGVCPPPTKCGWGEATYADESKMDHPVVCMDWEEARIYCEWMGGWLPTEAQWEKAARGTDGWGYPWGEEFDKDKCNSSESDINETTPIGFYSPDGDSPYELADMAGNVWEWVVDWYDIDYYANSRSQNPTGPVSGQRRVLRGGSWYGNYCNARTTYRYYDVPHGRGPGVGFRCVWSAGE